MVTLADSSQHKGASALNKQSPSGQPHGPAGRMLALQLPLFHVLGGQPRQRDSLGEDLEMGLHVSG